MNKKIGFIGFVPRNHGIRKGFPVKVAFFHQSHHYQIAQIIAEHERWVGYEPNTRAISVMLDTDSDVILETSSRKGVTQKRVITKDEMKCLMHYIVFFLKDYDIKNNQVIQEMNINILQDNRIISTILIKEVFCIVRRRGTVQIDFEEHTAYQTIGKEGILYGLYENRQMGISIEVRLTDPSEDHGIKIGISLADLMEGVSETDDVAICPTVNVGGNFEGSPVEMILSHCAELSQAALEGKGKVVVYHKSEKGSDHTEGGGGVSRRELSPSECTITKDKLLFNVDKPGLYTASMKDDMCVGKRVAMLAFLPIEMPKNRRPIIHLQFYFPFGELGQRLCDEWKAKDCVCVKDETTFILKHIGQDAKVEFETKFTQELSSILEIETLEIISYECLDFELDYSRLKTNDVDATVRIIQGECRAEIEIQGTLTAPEPEPVPEIEPEPEEPLPPTEPIRVPHRVSDKMIAEVAKYKIPSDRFSVLVNALGFTTKDFGKAVSDNISSHGSRKGYIGTKNILTRWRNKTEVAKQRPELREAFTRSNLPHLIKRYLKLEHDFLD